MKMIKQYPGDFDFRRKPGEPKDIFETRMRETNGTTEKYNWMPRDGRGFRERIKSGVQFPKQRKPDVFK
jgi:hypothetical protein